MAKRSVEIGGGSEDRVRSIEEVCARTLALGAAVALSMGAPATEIQDWLRSSNLAQHLTATEHKYIFLEPDNEKLSVAFSWQCERLLVLLWALSKVAKLPAMEEKCDPSRLAPLLPPYGDEDPDDFSGSSLLRTEEELFDFAVAIQHAHGRARGSRGSNAGQPLQVSAILEVLQERHHAANWLVGYCGQDWDRIRRDT